MTPTTGSAPPGYASYAPPAPAPSIRPSSRRPFAVWSRLAPAAIGAVVLAVAIATMTSWPVGVYYDDGIYLILGKALATGEGYRYLNLPGHPAATHYPPGYPALLALLWTIAPSFPENVALFKLVNAVLLGVAAAGLFAFARRGLGLATGMSAAAVLAGCLTVPVLAVAGVLFSEPMFLALLALALPACERAVRDQRPRHVVVAAMLAAAVTLVRSIGLSLVAALVLGLVLRRRHRAAVVAAAVAAAVMLPWQMWTVAHADGLPRVVAGNYGSYTATFGEATSAAGGVGFLARVARFNVRDLARPVGAVFAPGVSPTWRAVAVVAALTLLGVGASAMARSAPVTALFLLGYVAIVLAWPYAPDRFLWGIWPLVVLTLAVGVTTAARAARERTASRLPRVANAGLVLAATALTIGLVAYNVRGYRQQWWDVSQRAMARMLIPLAEWVERSTSPEDVIASDGEPLLHLYTGRLVVPASRWVVEAYPAQPGLATRVADLRELLATNKPRYLLLTNNRAPSGAASAALVQGPGASLRMLTVLPGGGAVFTTFTDIGRD